LAIRAVNVAQVHLVHDLMG